MSTERREVFLCHASEDKEKVVRPLAEAFAQARISCWHDEAEIKWGDSITEKVNEGLRISEYVIVVFSPTFAAKDWPKREMNAALNAEAASGKVRVLPLLVGTEHEKRQILVQFPLINDKRYLPWDGDPRSIVREMLNRLGREPKSPAAEGSDSVTKQTGLKIPLPRIKKRFTQHDKDIFLREAFSTVKQYFQSALDRLSSAYDEVVTDFAEVHNFKFTCTIYVRGEVASRCKIWIGGFISANSIAYQAGQFNIDNDNSLNDSLSVTDDEHSLGFEPSHMWFGRQEGANEGLLSAQQAAEYLWRRFTESLG